MNTTQTTQMTIEQVAALASSIAEAHAFDYAGNYGRGTFRFCVSVRASGNAVTLNATVNACVRIERAREELAKVWAALVASLRAQGAAAGFVMPKRRGAHVWRTGDWYMGHFHTDGLSRSIAAK